MPTNSKHSYIVSGYFYEINEFKFRKYLNIKKEGTLVQTPDLMVVMMNPGSSKPMDTKKLNIECDSKPDNTQYQIFKIMDEFGFQYARILNLSDYRNPKSKEFYPMIKVFKELNVPHSIFDNRRTNDLCNLFSNNVPVIIAWGVNINLKELAELALSKITSRKIFGLNKSNHTWAFYHPLPPIDSKQKEWLRNILQLIKSNK
tara:strand:- start:3828 stop:4433 length:606 start_codon:yes stop_codon:yes gene_type:complete